MIALPDRRLSLCLGKIAEAPFSKTLTYSVKFNLFGSL
jgi:hypothetical protein